MLVAAFLFGTLIGELQDIFYSINKSAREIESHIEEVSSFLISNRVSGLLQRKIKDWIRYKFSNDLADIKMQTTMSLLPNELQGGVAVSLNQTVFAKVNLFLKIHDHLDRAEFTAAILPLMKNRSFPPKTIIADHKVPANQLMIVSSGRVAMRLPKTNADHDELSTRPNLCMLQAGYIEVCTHSRWSASTLAQKTTDPT